MKKEEIDEAGETPKTSPNHKKSVKKQVDDEKEQKPSTSKDLDSESEPKLTKTSDKSTTKKKEEDSAKEEEHSDVDMEKEEKAEKTHLDVALLHNEPIYAELCSFFNMFGALLNMKPISFDRLDKMFCTFHDGEVDEELIDLHIQMMRKIYLKSARADKWENSLVKFCSVCPALESELLQLQRYSYNDLPLSLKLTMLKALCESQFDCNVKFKENLFNTFQTNEIRISPIGVDLNGLSYYYQQDCELNIRVYTVEPGLKAELAFLIDLLKSPDFGKRGDDAKEDEEIDEDQLVNKNPTQNGEEAKSSNAEQKPLPADIEMTVEERQGIQMFNKRYSFWDCYQDGSNLNKKKTAKELRKKEKESSVQPPTNVKFEEKPEPREIAKDKRGEVEEDAFKSSGDECKKKEEEPVHPELEESLIALASEERRIMPRRSARSNAINNMKAYTAPPKKGILALTNTPSTPKAKKSRSKASTLILSPSQTQATKMNSSTKRIKRTKRATLRMTNSTLMALDELIVLSQTPVDHPRKKVPKGKEEMVHNDKLANLQVALNQPKIDHRKGCCSSSSQSKPS